MLNYLVSLLFICVFFSPLWASPLVDFQVAQPLTLPSDAKQCTVKILERTFAFSYGSPEVVSYTPATDCGTPGSWAGISLNLTVTSNGTQYDRLGIFTLNNVEIWRTSTPEPTRGDGIIWTYLKDVTRYTPLFAVPGTFTLELDNLIETGLDGEYASVLYATFYASSAQHPPGLHADVILPISTLANNSGDLISVPPTFSLNVTVPRNAISIYAEIIPSGNGDEEFWCFNIPNQWLNDLPADTTFGYGPFREVRLMVDGSVVGVVFPYVVVFTGGIAPTLWRPITSYGALDLPTFYVDLTPFVPVLTDGQPHNISMDVVSAENDHEINQNWYLTANLQVVTDKSSTKPTTGKITVYDVQPFAETTTFGSVKNGVVSTTVTATRNIHIESDIISGSGERTHVVWLQSLSYSNVQTYRQNASVQTLRQTTTGSVSSTHNGQSTIVDNFSLPFNVDFTYLTPDWTNWTTSVDHSYNRVAAVHPYVISTTIKNHQTAAAFFQLASTGNFGFGNNSNTFSYSDLNGNTYTWDVSSVNTSITHNAQGGTLAQNHQLPDETSSEVQSIFAKPRLPGRNNP
ncbi:hypothetical protein NM688_g6033 [Phlebia brevispora]|uniref:Uncharacterized protein n=1 Tax=Phlebia brevispora TaxID=194682 RepID=A0ACC1SKS3_9APHY|nr:hypothetical protein NM688_g6033 [Phlebia brevispora]